MDLQLSIQYYTLLFPQYQNTDNLVCPNKILVKDLIFCLVWDFTQFLAAAFKKKKKEAI